ncbi:MAG: cobalamin-dependent protein [Dehalococcoidales bacterium]|nr:cobalamin-dependent protein [Dehalococcoidales bacterium]
MSISEIAEAFADLEEDEVLGLIREEIEAGTDPLAIVGQLQAGMGTFGERYRSGDYYIGDLILSGEIFNQSMKLLEPLLIKSKAPSDAIAIMVLGTVKGDIHNLGKDILAVLMKASGFEVIDLGINVAPAVFVEKLRETGATLLGLSGLITTSFESMKETVEAVTAAGLRDRVKVIIGGGVVDERVRDYTGADAFSTDAMDGIESCRRLTGVDHD